MVLTFPMLLSQLTSFIHLEMVGKGPGENGTHNKSKGSSKTLKRAKLPAAGIYV